MGPFKSILRSKWLVEQINTIMDEHGNLREPPSVSEKKAENACETARYHQACY
jgi:hypothetical protein